MKIDRLLQTVAIQAALLSATASAQPETASEPHSDAGGSDRWSAIVAFPMLWAPSIDLEIEAAGNITDATISFDEILADLQMGMMGEFYLTRDRLGFFLKGMYMDVNDSLGYRVDIPVGDASGLDLDTDITMKMGLYDIGMRWSLWRNLRLIALGRATTVEVEVGLKGNFALQIPCNVPIICEDGQSIVDINEDFDESFDINPDTAWDFNLGLEHDWWLGEAKRHGIRLYGDVAVAGDSDSAWQLDLRYLYRVSDLNNFWLGWRHYETKSHRDAEGNQTTVDLSGPLLGWAFSF